MDQKSIPKIGSNSKKMDRFLIKWLKLSKNGTIFILHKWINNQDWIETGSNSKIPKLKKWIKYKKLISTI